MKILGQHKVWNHPVTCPSSSCHSQSALHICPTVMVEEVETADGCGWMKKHMFVAFTYSMLRHVSALSLHALGSCLERQGSPREPELTSGFYIEKPRQAAAPISLFPIVLALSAPISARSCLGAVYCNSCLIPYICDHQVMQFLPSYDSFAGLQQE